MQSLDIKEINGDDFSIYAQKKICGCYTIKIAQRDCPDIEVTYKQMKALVDSVTTEVIWEGINFLEGDQDV